MTDLLLVLILVALLGGGFLITGAFQVVLWIGGIGLACLLAWVAVKLLIKTLDGCVGLLDKGAEALSNNCVEYGKFTIKSILFIVIFPVMAGIYAVNIFKREDIEGYFDKAGYIISYAMIWTLTSCIWFYVFAVHFSSIWKWWN